jgi:hypothetical protein
MNERIKKSLTGVGLGVASLSIIAGFNASSASALPNNQPKPHCHSVTIPMPKGGAFVQKTCERNGPHR